MFIVVIDKFPQMASVHKVIIIFLLLVSLTIFKLKRKILRMVQLLSLTRLNNSFCANMTISLDKNKNFIRTQSHTTKHDTSVKEISA